MTCNIHSSLISVEWSGRNFTCRKTGTSTSSMSYSDFVWTKLEMMKATLWDCPQHTHTYTCGENVLVALPPTSGRECVTPLLCTCGFWYGFLFICVHTWVATVQFVKHDIHTIRRCSSSRTPTPTLHTLHTLAHSHTRTQTHTHCPRFYRWCPFFSTTGSNLFLFLLSLPLCTLSPSWHLL